MRVFCVAGFTGCVCFVLLGSQDARFMLLDSQDAGVLCCSLCHLTGVGTILTGENRSTHR
jgi:hypothetical protein